MAQWLNHGVKARCHTVLGGVMKAIHAHVVRKIYLFAHDSYT